MSGTASWLAPARGVLLASLMMLVTACGSAGAPVDPAGDVVARRPQPANVGGAEEVTQTPGKKVDCGNPEASLKPSGLSIPAGSTMDKIRKRGHLVVGVDQNTFLFGFYNPTTGDFEGFDIDIAREVAKAIFGDPGRIVFRAITSKQREEVLANKEVDIVVRTMTINCDRKQRITFSTTYFVAGQRLLVRQDAKATTLADLEGKKVCATKGSTSLRNIAEEGSTVPVSVDNWSDCLVLFQQGQVEGISTDDTILAGMAQQDPTARVVGKPFSREPYGIGIPKEHEDMVRFVNAVLDKVRGGTWEALYAKWVQPALGKPASYPKPVYQ